ncbi:MAG TPA: hypothetical protein PK264_03105, partial [Hyphomicrobiaceae bacterium]|nr:hypothetical protein [Hyphomicrobiaceae bacterium]
MLAIRSAFSLAFLIAGSISMLTQLSTEARGQSRCESRSSASCTKKGESFSCSGITYPKEFYCRCYLTDDGCVEDNLPSHIFRLDTATDAVKELQKKLGVKKVT